MNPMQRALLLGLALLGAVACSTTIRPDELQAWVGRPAAALEREWGPPTRQAKDGDLTILIYEEVERTSNVSRPEFATSGGSARSGTSAVADAARQPVGQGPRVYVRSYLFWVNPAGSIVRSAVREP